MAKRTYQSKAERLNQRRLLVIARLGGPSWWKHKTEHYGVYWHWDGKDSWFAEAPKFRFGESKFTPEGMLEMGDAFELVDDPRKKKRQKP